MAEQSATWRLELRRAGEGSEHTLTGLVIPYGQTSYRTEHRAGERFIAGAFSGAVANPGKIRLTDSHLPGRERRPVGVAATLQEAREGLVGTFRFYDTPEGRGAYENVAEGTYGGLSVGFTPRRERVASDGVREVLEAHLFHVSLVDEPAYDEARVLAVRAAEDALTTEVAGLLSRDWSTVWR